jgi:transposase
MEKGEKRERRSYTQEFKLEAVRLVRTGISKARVARDLGLHLNVVREWVRQFDKDPDKSVSWQGEDEAGGSGDFSFEARADEGHGGA